MYTQKRSDRQAASASRKSAAAAAATSATADSPHGESRESLEVLADGNVAEEENEANADDDRGMGDSEDGEWDAGFEESSDEGEEESQEQVMEIKL